VPWQICTRLPSPELAFQSGHPIPGCFLPEAIAVGEHNFLSPLAESAIVVTICGRALSHGQLSGVERAFGGASLDFWLRHEWLDGMLTRTLESLSMSAPVVSAMADPMAFFVLMMAHATMIFLGQIAEASGMDHHCRPPVLDYQQRAMRAAHDIASLAKAHEHIGYFKVRHVRPRANMARGPVRATHARLMHNNPRGQAHIFLPLAVSLGAMQLTGDRKRRLDGHRAFYDSGLDGRDTGSRLDVEVRCCMDALRKIQSFNHLARDHLAVLESQEFVFGGL
jgi:hypothetical protein